MLDALLAGVQRILGDRFAGLYLYGSLAAGDFDPVPPDDLRGAVRGILREWWEPLLLDTERLRADVYRAYAVLTMCRALYTLRHGAIASKPVSAGWARSELGGRWAGLIERASAWRHDAPAGDLSGAADFVRFTLGRARSTES